MKLNYTLITIFLFISNLLLAQQDFITNSKTSTYIAKAQIECIYSYTVIAPITAYYKEKEKEGDHKEKVTYKILLQASSTVSKFWDWNSFKKDSILFTSTKPFTKEENDSLSMKYYFLPRNLYLTTIIKNYPKNTITVTDEMAANDFIYSQDKTCLNWTLVDDTLTVCGYTCNKAQCSYGGREWTAWYAPELSISDGPWKLYGLPGLILKAQDSTLIHTFEAINIRNSELPIYMSKNGLQIKTERKVFVRNKNQFEKDPFEYFKKVPVKGKMVEGNMLMNGKRAIWQIRTDFCPLELE